jgi:hypothetical protein
MELDPVIHIVMHSVLSLKTGCDSPGQADENTDFVSSVGARPMKIRLISSAYTIELVHEIIWLFSSARLRPMKLEVVHEIELLWCSGQYVLINSPQPLSPCTSC